MINTSVVTQEVGGTVVGFSAGLRASVRGFNYMRANPTLWPYAVLPMVLNILITLAVLGGLIAAGVMIIVWRSSGDGAVTWWSVTRETLIAIALLITAVGLALVTWWLMNGVLLGHFYSKLAMEVEKRLGIGDGEIREVPIKQEIIDALIDTALMLLVLGGFLLFQLIPIIGTVVGLAGWVYFNGYILGRDMLEHPLSLRGWRRAERRAFARRHKGAVFGQGIVVFGLTFVPILGAMLQTGSVVGAVLLHRDLLAIEADLSSLSPRAASEAT